MPIQKLKWSDSEDIAFLLIDKYPSVDPMRLSLDEVQKRAAALTELKGISGKPSDGVIETIQKVWFEERADMEDELGPFEAEPVDDLDEDDYSSGRMIDEEESVVAGDDDDDEEDAEEFGDGFQEEEIEEGR